MFSAIALFDANYLGGRLRRYKRSFRKRKNRLKRKLLLKIIDLSHIILWDLYQIPWQVLRDIAHKFARYAGDIGLLFFQFPRLPAHKLTGANYSIIFVGNKSHLLQLRNLFFKDGFSQEKMGQIAFWKLSAQTKQWLAQGEDLVVCQLSRLYPGRPSSSVTFTIPCLVEQFIPIPNQFEKVIAGKKFRHVRASLNRAERAGFNYKFSRSLPDFNYFYYDMYLPFIKSKHGDLAAITPYEIQRRWFDKGGVLLINQYDKPVAGALCRIANDTFFLIELGVLGTDTEIIQLGFYNVITWYALTLAREKGAKIFSMGGTRGLCSYPSFISKRRWGARVSRHREIYPTWTFLASDMSTVLQSHLNKARMITEINGNFYRIFVTGDINSIAPRDVDNEVTMAKKEGLDGVMMVSSNSKLIINNNS